MPVGQPIGLGALAQPSGQGPDSLPRAPQTPEEYEQNRARAEKFVNRLTTPDGIRFLGTMGAWLTEGQGVGRSYLAAADQLARTMEMRGEEAGQREERQIHRQAGERDERRLQLEGRSAQARTRTDQARERLERRRISEIERHNQAMEKIQAGQYGPGLSGLSERAMELVGDPINFPSHENYIARVYQQMWNLGTAEERAQMVANGLVPRARGEGGDGEASRRPALRPKVERGVLPVSPEDVLKQPEPSAPGPKGVAAQTLKEQENVQRILRQHRATARLRGPLAPHIRRQKERLMREMEEAIRADQQSGVLSSKQRQNLYQAYRALHQQLQGGEE